MFAGLYRRYALWRSPTSLPGGWAIVCLTGELQSGGTFFFTWIIGNSWLLIEDHTVLGFDPL